MISISLHWKTCFGTYLTAECIDLFVNQLQIFASFTIVRVLFWDYCQAITSKMEACIAPITVNNLIRLAIVGAETNFAIGLEIFFFVLCFYAFGWFFIKILLVFLVDFEHMVSLIFKTLLKTSKNSPP